MKKSDDLYLELVTPEHILFSGDIGLVDLPGKAGRFTMLRDHGNIISTLAKGSIRIVGKDNVERIFECSGGVVECVDNKVTVLISNHPE